MTVPQIRLHGSQNSSTATLQLEIFGFTPDLYGYQWVISRITSTGTPVIQNSVTGWSPASSSTSGIYSLVALDFTLSHPLGSQANALSVMTIPGYANNSILSLNSVVLTQMKSGSQQALDLDLNAIPVDWVIDGPVGVTLKDWATSGRYTGGEGVDTLVFSKTRASYNVTRTPASINITDISSGASDLLTKFERLQFSDAGVAYDLDGSAGNVSKILGALWGSGSVTSAKMVGAGLSLFDQGLDTKQVMHIALPARLGASYQAADVITLLYQNLTHKNPNLDELNYWQSQVGIGKPFDSYDSLAIYASELALNTSAIGLTGLQSSGVSYIY